MAEPVLLLLQMAHGGEVRVITGPRALRSSAHHPRSKTSAWGSCTRRKGTRRRLHAADQPKRPQSGLMSRRVGGGLEASSYCIGKWLAGRHARAQRGNPGAAGAEAKFWRVSVRVLAGSPVSRSVIGQSIAITVQSSYVPKSYKKGRDSIAAGGAESGCTGPSNEATGAARQSLRARSRTRS